MNVNFQKCALVFGAMFLLNACSVPVSKKMNKKVNDKTASQTNNSTAIVNNQSSISARNYTEKKECYLMVLLLPRQVMNVLIALIV